MISGFNIYKFLFQWQTYLNTKLCSSNKYVAHNCLIAPDGKGSSGNLLVHLWSESNCQTKTNWEYLFLVDHHYDPCGVDVEFDLKMISGTHQISGSATLGARVLCFLTGFAGQLCLLALVRRKTFHSQAGTSLFKMSVAAAGAKSPKIHVAEWGRIANRVAHKFHSLEIQSKKV